MAKIRPHQKKSGPTPPAPQNGMRRAMFFYPTKDSNPHSKAQLLTIAIDRAQKGVKDVKKTTSDITHM